MLIRLFFLLFIFLGCGNSSGFAQRTCLSAQKDTLYRSVPGAPTNQDFEQWMNKEIVAMKKTGNQGFGSAIKTIPVVFHVIYSNTAENISDDMINSQMEILNDDFRRMNADTTNTPSVFKPFAADCQVEFCLAKLDPNNNATDGIDRIFMSGSPFSDTYIDATIKPATFWDPTKYLNIWVVNIQGNLLGWATFPGQSGLGGMPTGSAPANEDGVVLLYTSVGAPPYNTFSGPYNLGRTATHEVGHFLGLRHIWGDGNCSVDDYCGDTPLSDASNGGCPVTNSCTDSPIDYNDMVQNYMDYTNDACMNIFTDDQAARMAVVLAISPMRASLTTSTVCNTNSVPAVDFSASDSSVCLGQTVVFKDISGFTPTSWSWTFSPGTVSFVSSTSASSQDPQVVFNAAGNYSVTLAASNSNGSDTLTKTSFISVTGPGLSLPFVEGFESGSFNTQGWTKTNPDASFTWAIKTVSGNPPGSKAAWINYFDYTDIGERDRITSPPLDFSGFAAINLEFDHAYARYNSGSDDSLIVLVSSDCGLTWDRVLELGENGSFNFRTRPDLQIAFTPSIQSDWCGSGTGASCKSVNLSSYAGNSNVQVMFESYNDYGNNLFLDNINITGTVSNQPPVAAFQSSVTSGCGSLTASFTDVSTGSPTSWFWYFGDGGTSTLQNPSHTWTSPGIYSMALIVNNAFGSDTLLKTNYISTFPIPSASISNFVNSGCGLNNGTATASGNGGSLPYSYSWNTAVPQVTQTASGLSPGTYSVTVTDINACSASATVTIAVNASVGLSLPFTENFEGGSFNPAKWTLVNPDSNITWAVKTTAGNFGSKAAWVDFYNYNDPGQRDYLITPALDFTGYTTVTLGFEHAYCRFNSSGTDSLIVRYSTDCGLTWKKIIAYGENGSGTFATRPITTSPFTPALSSDWCTSGTGLACQALSLNSLIGLPSVMIKFESYTDYQNNLFLDNINISGTGGIAPDAGFTAQASEGCDDFTVNFVDLSLNNPSQWLWDFGDGSSFSSLKNPTHTYSNPGTYTVQLGVGNSFGIDTITKTNYITVYPNPFAIIQGFTDASCGSANGSATAIATGTGGTYTYSWNTFPVQDSQTAVALTAGTYMVIATDMNSCTASASVTIGNLPGPVVSFSNVANATCDNIDGSATAQVTGGTPPYQFAWNTSPVQNTSSASGLPPGNYLVTVTDSNGCSTSKSVLISSPGLPARWDFQKKFF